MATTIAFLAIVGTLVVGAELMLRNANNLLTSIPNAGHNPGLTKSGKPGLLSNVIQLALGLALFQEGIWLAHLFLQR